MATKVKHGLNGVHTAGIFSDMTVDGPEIGTLVVIVDRAKNLPNRKTIGKQDPYCAARLGKEAKKTETDRRGGQTPRWDQELRYTVHDSPDYYQLKVSVFNDDKKTDLIGETWVDLKEVVVPGGGQNDLWHNLSCKGKYAGEIRIEITYYDTRPKQEKARSKEPVANGVEDGSKESLKGPRQPKPGVKRRPLPSDPITGEPAPAPTAIPDHVSTPPRGYPPSPTAVPEYPSYPTRSFQNSPSTIPDHFQTPPRGYSSSATTENEHPHTSTRAHQASYTPQPDHAHASARGYQLSSNGTPDHNAQMNRGYQTPSAAVPEHFNSSQKRHQSPGYIPNHSPLQSLEYNIPSPKVNTSRNHEGSKNSGAPLNNTAFTPNNHHLPNDRYESYGSMGRNDYSSDPRIDQYDEEGLLDERKQHRPRQASYDIPPMDVNETPPSPGGPPPPPPVHRSRNGSSHASPLPAPVLSHQNSYGPPTTSRPTNQYDIAPAYETHNHSVPAYTQSQAYQAYSPERDRDQSRSHTISNYEESPPRNHSYHTISNNDLGAMQPTVEDAPPSPGAGHYLNYRSSRTSQYNDPQFEKVPSPAPLNIGNRSGSSSAQNGSFIAPSHQLSNSSLGYNSTSSHMSYRDQPTPAESLSSRTSYNSMPQERAKPRSHSANDLADIYGLPQLPTTLVAGMDPIIAQEIADRIYDEKRAAGYSTGHSSRGRYQNASQQAQYSARANQETSGPQHVPASSSYDDHEGRYSTATVPVVKPRAISPDPRSGYRNASPNPRSSTMRKSVSPSPGPADDRRRLSGVPFGPDSYNAFNPTVSASPSTPSFSASYDTKPLDPDAKTITHDGREIDPSDHIPESNYAPLLESKGPKYASQQPDRSYRPPPSASQTAANTSRRPLRQAPRPQSMAATSPMYIHGSSYDPSTPPSNRNRLQKKTNRMSAQAPQSSPLAPISPYNDNSFTPSSLPRAHTIDFNASENYAPPKYGSSPGYRGSGAPPLPAKVPVGMDHYGEHSPARASGGDAWALLEEMKNIDLGSGRARRRGY